jgi:two-component system response regulator CpxR
MKPKRTILCAEGNEQALSIRKILLETRGYRVICCTRAEEALELIRDCQVDLVIADLMLPDLDGARLIEAIKISSPLTPAILLSSRLNIFEYETHADVFLPKNAQSSAELLGHVRALLVRRRGPRKTLVTPTSARTLVGSHFAVARA